MEHLSLEPHTICYCSGAKSRRYNVAKSAAWWQQFVEADETERLAIARSGGKSPNRNRNATQRRRRPRAPNADGSAATSAPKTSGTPKAKAAE